MYTANINEARANFSQLINRVLAGDEVFIARANQPIVRLIPVDQDFSPRAGGFWAGQIKYSQDWDQSDNEIAALFDSSQIFPVEGA